MSLFELVTRLQVLSVPMNVVIMIEHLFYRKPGNARTDVSAWFVHTYGKQAEITFLSMDGVCRVIGVRVACANRLVNVDDVVRYIPSERVVLQAEILVQCKRSIFYIGHELLTVARVFCLLNSVPGRSTPQLARGPAAQSRVLKTDVLMASTVYRGCCGIDVP